MHQDRHQMAVKIHDRKEGRSANIGFAKWRVQCFYDSLVQGSSSVFQMNIRAKNPPFANTFSVTCKRKNDRANKTERTKKMCTFVTLNV